MSDRAKHSLSGSFLPQGLRRILIASAGAHVAVVIGVMIWSSVAHTADSSEPQAFIATKLVKLGKKRDKKLLPRIPSKPPPAAREAVALDSSAQANTSKSAEPDRKKVPTAKERLAQMSSLSSALDRVRKNAEEGEGDPNGVEGGEVTDASKAVLGAKFATEIYRCIKSNFTVEGMDESKAKTLNAKLLVRVQGDGRLFDPTLQKSSKNRIFDSSVLDAVKKCGRVSPPPDPLKEVVRSHGILVLFKP